MNDTLEKIKAGQISIEREKLIGLGMKGNESIDVVKLNELIEACGKSGCINVLCKTISAIASIHASNRELEDGDMKDYVDEYIIAELPDYREIYVLQRMIDVFNTYQP